jgi:hypothetical protein
MNWDKLGSISTTNQARNKWTIFMKRFKDFTKLIWKNHSVCSLILHINRGGHKTTRHTIKNMKR